MTLNKTKIKHLALALLTGTLSGCLTPLQVETVLPPKRLEPLQAAYGGVAPTWFIVDEPSQALKHSTLASDPLNAGFKLQFPIGELFTAYLTQAQAKDARKVPEGKRKVGMRHVAIRETNIEYSYSFTNMVPLDWVDLTMVIETRDPQKSDSYKTEVHQEVTLSVGEAVGVNRKSWAFELAMERCVLEYLTKVAERERPN